MAEKEKPLFAKRVETLKAVSMAVFQVLEGHYNSTVGDRLIMKNTFREYVAYDAAATYLEYILYYRRKGLKEPVSVHLWLQRSAREAPVSSERSEIASERLRDHRSVP